MARAGTLPTVLTGVFVAILDFFIVNVAIPTMQRDLRAGPAAVEWVVAGYALAYGSGLVLGGRLGDVFGRRRMFALGLALFTLASVACGLAPDAGSLVVARVVQGAAAAVLAPQVLAVIRTAYSGAAQARAVNAYALTMGLAAVFGQLAGGLLIQADLFGLGWRACFLINLPIGVVALAATWRVIPESRAAGAVRLDLGGAALVTLALAATLLPLIEGREQGWPVWTWVSFALAVALLLAYARRRHDSPLIDLALFRERAVTAGLLTNLAFSMGMAAYFLIFAMYSQEGRGLDALQAGLVFTPIGAGYLAASLAAPRLAARFGRQIIAFGGLTRAVSLAVLLVAVTGNAPIGWLVPVLAVDGAGMGLVLSPIMGTVLSRVAPHHAGGAAGALTTAQQVGGALGVGIIGIVFYSALSGGVTVAFQHGLVYLIVITLAIAALVQWLPRARAAA
ncbi:drug resistance transporter, EmrB/QacA subfamily [Microbispora rosea]|uniref:Drug resistance transporter, EmrB/QacA subfamily n=1 Tax=Microbispora rosea TaxID=58117 RepID=A0A1N7A4J7_9ACTN|nr:MFS transporter [Microbispora rosea]GIH48243.1 MFS transporter [Microbispora rosea subsp. rosea]SIR33943.1 drug resistance transporter, EmrB/QacA subfamily [Microbispora rosea]